MKAMGLGQQPVQANNFQSIPLRFLFHLLKYGNRHGCEVCGNRKRGNFDPRVTRFSNQATLRGPIRLLIQLLADGELHRSIFLNQ